MRKTIFLLAITFLLSHDQSAQIPATSPLPNLKKWLIAKPAANGATVLSDHTGPDAAPPVFEKTAGLFPMWLNYNPAVYFDGKSSGVLAVPLDQIDITKKTILIVSAATDTISEGCLWVLEQNGKSQLLMTTRRIADLKNYRYLNFSSINGTQANLITYYGSTEQQSPAGGDQVLRIGGKPREAELPAAAFKGAIAEFLLFDRVLSGLERAQAESYLAIKYGIGRQGDYYDSRGEKIWDARKNALFSENIAGIGRDDAWHLRQNQACGNHPKPLFKIGVDTIATCNAANQANLNDRAFLLWGDNGKLPFFDESLDDSTRLLSRQWLAVARGSAGEVATEIQFSPGQLAERPAPDEQYALAIDRSGTGRFDVAATELFTAAANPADDGSIVFKNIHWDTDGSGSDVFTLAALSESGNRKNEQPENTQELFTAVELWPNPTADGFFQVAVKLKQATDLDCRIMDTAGKVIFNDTLAGSDRYFFSQLLPQRGAFILSLTNGRNRWATPVVVP